MKKILMISLMLVLLATTVCFAADEQVYEPVEPIVPAYVTATDVTTKLQILSGNAEYITVLVPNQSKTITKVVATIKLVDGKGTAVHTKTGEMYKEGRSYKMTSTKALSQRGSYHVETTLRVYDGAKLLETIHDQSGEVSW